MQVYLSIKSTAVDCILNFSLINCLFSPGFDPSICPWSCPGAVHPTGDLLGQDEPEYPHLLFTRTHRKGR